ncbi:MAG: SDR family NAD(P)-dependent oxidoreductase [Bacteroidia bacterium]
MKKLILITGASTGIGREMALQLAAAGCDLVITARSADKLMDLKTQIEAQHPCQVYVYEADLSVQGAAEVLYKRLREAELQPTHLVNNAGMGLYGAFAASGLEENLQMMQLNMQSLVALSHLFIADRLPLGSGKILNVASLLSFLPLPYYSTYSATKAFVLAFGQTLDAELEGSGLVVTTLCPGPTDTPFTTLAMSTTRAYQRSKPVAAEVVAQQGVQLLLHGKGTKVVGFQNWFVSNLPRITPDFLMMKIKKRLATSGS